MVIMEAIKEIIWLQGSLANLGLVQEHVNVYCDSQGTIDLVNNQVYHIRTKHILFIFKKSKLQRISHIY